MKAEFFFVVKPGVLSKKRTSKIMDMKQIDVLSCKKSALKSVYN